MNHLQEAHIKTFSVTLGTLSVHLISDGVFSLDGGVLFGVVPKTLWSSKVAPDRKNRVVLGLNSLLIQTGVKNILVDPGIGTKLSLNRKSLYDAKCGRLLTGLKELGLEPSDINLVVLTHLHFDHAGGCTYFNNWGRPVLTFPIATHIVQQSEWEEATHTNERTNAAYSSEDFRPLQEQGKLELINGDIEISPGILVTRTGGHTSGHQGIVIQSKGETAAYLGDILPTPHHVRLPYITAADLEPLKTLRKKRELLDQAETERWLLLFGHGLDQKYGYLENVDGKLALKTC